jgi:hypothetical protein
MNDNQVINLNIGLNWTDGNDEGQFPYNDALALVGWKFNFCKIEHVDYVSSWDDGKRTYVDNCIAVRITVPEDRDYLLEEITEKVNSLRVILKQDAISYDIWGANGGRDSEVYYGPKPPSDKLEFDPSCFRYL